MQIDLDRVSAFDTVGNEHYILDFPGQNSLPIKGMASGHFLRSKSVISLPKGDYTTLRFYLNGNNNMLIYSDGNSELANEIRHLNFTIENGLTVSGNEAKEVKLWFDFVPFTFGSYFKVFTDLFKKRQNNQRPRLAGSF